MMLELLATLDPTSLSPDSVDTDVLAKGRGGGGKGFKVSAPIVLIIIAAIIGAIARFCWPRRDQIVAYLQSAASGGPAGPGGPGRRGSPAQPSPGDVQVALDPRTPSDTLVHMVNNAPPLRPYVAANPSTEPGLLNYLGGLGDPAVNQALAARGGPAGMGPGPAAPQTGRPGPVHATTPPALVKQFPGHQSPSAPGSSGPFPTGPAHIPPGAPDPRRMPPPGSIPPGPPPRW